MSKIDINNITSGAMNGQMIWVCDFRYTDFDNKAARNLKPTQVLVRSNSAISKTIYYSESHLVGLNAKGEPVASKVIGPYDNTGFRSFKGVPINCFETERECIAYYKKQVKAALKGLNEHKLSKIQALDAKIAELEKEL
jgi:hypothetical protein